MHLIYGSGKPGKIELTPTLVRLVASSGRCDGVLSDNVPVAASLIVPAREQHTVSRVVLRGFTWGSKITVYDRERDIIHPIGTRGVFKMRNFDGHDPVAAEKRWREVENKMHRVYGLVERRAVLGDSDAVDTLRDLLAVHWARSPATKAVH